MKDHRVDLGTRSPSNISRMILICSIAFLLTFLTAYGTVVWMNQGQRAERKPVLFHPHADQSDKKTILLIDDTPKDARRPVQTPISPKLPDLACIMQEGVNVSKMSLTTLPIPLFSGDGYRSMYLYSNNDIVSTAIVAGGWEQPEIEALAWAMSQQLPPGYEDKKVFVDIGANVGWFTLNMAARGYNVEAFEAMTSNQQLILATSCTNLDLKPRIKLHKHGLGSEPKTCFVFSGDSNEGDGVTECAWANEDEASKKVPPGYSLRGKMEIKRLDGIIQSDVKAMKMDTEGYEPFILDGASGLIKNHKVWFIALELNSVLLKGIAKVEPLDYMKRLEAMGYRVSLKDFRGPFEDLSSPANLGALKAKVDPPEGTLVTIFCTHKTFLDQNATAATPVAAEKKKEASPVNGTSTLEG